MRKAMFLVVFALLAATCVRAQPPKGADGFTFLSDEVKTPCLTWAKPLAGGKLRTLCLVDGTGAGREVVELAQRMDFAVDTTFLIAGNKSIDWELGNGYTTALTNEMMTQGLKRVLQKDYDLFIISGPVWKLFDKADMERVKTLVRNGAGLVGITPSDWIDPSVAEMFAIGAPSAPETAGVPWAMQTSGPPATGVPFEVFPPSGFRRYADCRGAVVAKLSNGAPLITTSSYGKGRVCLMTWFAGAGHPGAFERTSALTPFVDPPDSCDYAYWEYYFSLLGKASLWAAGRLPEKGITGVKLEGDASKGQGQVQVTLAEGTTGNRLAVRVWRKDLFILEQTAGQPAANAASVTIKSVIPAGLIFIDVFLQNDKGEVLDWYSAAVHVKSEVRIAGIQTNKESYDQDDTVTGSVKLSGRHTAPIELEMSLRDGYQRLIGSSVQKLDADLTGADFAFPIPPISHARMYLCAEVRSAGGVISSETKRLIYRRPYQWDDPASSTWLTTVWQGQRSYLVRAAMRQMGAAHLGSILGQWCEQESNAWTRALADENMYLIIKYGPWTQASHAPELKEQIVGSVHGLNNVASKYGAILYVNADEMDAPEAVSAPIMAAFRKWLQKSYGDLDALNKEWDTEYKRWEDVEFIGLEELKKRPSKNFSPWSDRHWFMTDSVGDEAAVATEAAKSIFPSYRAGTSGAFKPDPRTYDYWRLCRAWTGGLSYANISQIQLMRSFNPDIKHHVFIGYDSPGFYNNFRTWMGMFEGASGVDWHNARLMVLPDLSLTRSGRDSAETQALLNRGIGRMLMSARPDRGSVALHYSQASIHLAFLNGMTGVHENSREGARFLLTEAGIPWHFLSYEQLAQDEWQTSGDRALILPFSLAMSDQEVEGVRRFVKQGGTVIADIVPALYDGHCKRRARSAADDIFGVDSSAMKLGVERMNLSGAAEMTLPAQKVTTFCKALKLTTATAYGGLAPSNQPALVVNKLGKGRAILLNGDLFQAYCTARENCFQSAADLAIVNAIQKSIVDELAHSTVRPELKVMDAAAEGVEAPLLGKYCMTDGGVRYFGTVRYNDTLYAVIDTQGVIPKNKQALFQFPVETHLYNVLTKEYLGKVRQARADLDVVGNSLFAAMPYKIDSIRISADRQEYARGARVRLALSVQCEAKERQKHFARVRVLAPDGREYGPYTRNLTLPAGAAEYLIQLALDEQPGKWTAEVEEIVSGARNSTTFTVTER